MTRVTRRRVRGVTSGGVCDVTREIYRLNFLDASKENFKYFWTLYQLIWLHFNLFSPVD